MNHPRRLFLATVVVSCLALWAGYGSAAAAAEPEAVTIDVSTMPFTDQRGHEVSGQYWIVATLTTADGQPVTDRKVDFRRPVDFFGAREEKLGSAVTDYTGLAAVVYEPSQKGTHEVVARFAGDQQYAAAEGTLDFEASTVVAPFSQESPPLASVGTWLSVFLGVLGVVFWGVLLGVLGRTVRGIRAAATTMVTAASSAQDSMNEEARMEL